jgi:environmental stress-induced protein Ves
MRRSGYRLLRHRRYREMPWRNGGGVTLEIAREPANGEEFAWRLSLAQIGGSCDFSPYPGYRRAIVLVDGALLQLRFRGHGGCSLGLAKRGTRFDGDWKTRCVLPRGPCTDLSLIVRKGLAPSASVVRAPTLLRIGSTRRLVLPRGPHAALFVIDGLVAITGPAGERSRLLRARDTFLLTAGSGSTLTLRNLGERPALLALLRWLPGRE